MTSEMAIEDIEEMQEEGLKPTPRDIIRLNAIGLKVELSRVSATVYELPRVAFLGDIVFREPTIGHNIWIDTALLYCDANDLSTRLAVDAFALSRGLSSLPDANDRKEVIKAVDAFTKKDIAHFTANQVRCALTYAMHGSNAIENEFPPLPPDADEWEVDDASSIGAGILFETLAMGLGLSVRDICSMPKSTAKALQEAGLAARGINITKRNSETRVAEYMATKSEITTRLKTEASNGGH